jgi:hypothetical protein
LLTGLWMEGQKTDERRVKQHGHLEERCAYCIAQKKGLAWSPAIVRVNQLPKLRPGRSNAPQKEDGGPASSSTQPPENGSSHLPQTQSLTTSLPSTTLTYRPILGGNVSGAVAPRGKTG